MASSFFLPVGPNRWHVHTYGSGPKIVIAWHGFGRSGERMGAVGELVSREYTVYAPDLPYHGRTNFPADFYRPADLLAVVNALRAERKFDRFTLLGHSLGGRISLVILPALAEFIDGFLLIAPDGLGGRYTNWIDRTPFPLKRGLARWADNPRRVRGLVNTLHRRGLVPGYIHQYLDHHLYQPASRRMALASLRSVEYFRVEARAVQDALAEKNIPARLLAGTEDPLIRLDRIRNWVTHVPALRLVEYAGSHWIPAQLVAKKLREMAGRVSK